MQRLVLFIVCLVGSAKSDWWSVPDMFIPTLSESVTRLKGAADVAHGWLPGTSDALATLNQFEAAKYVALLATEKTTMAAAASGTLGGKSIMRKLLRASMRVLSRTVQTGLLAIRIAKALKAPSTRSQRVELVADALQAAIPLLELVILMYEPAKPALLAAIDDAWTDYGSHVPTVDQLLALLALPLNSCPPVLTSSPFKCWIK